MKAECPPSRLRIPGTERRARKRGGLRPPRRAAASAGERNRRARGEARPRSRGTATRARGRSRSRRARRAKRERAGEAAGTPDAKTPSPDLKHARRDRRREKDRLRFQPPDRKEVVAPHRLGRRLEEKQRPRECREDEKSRDEARNRRRSRPGLGPAPAERERDDDAVDDHQGRTGVQPDEEERRENRALQEKARAEAPRDFFFAGQPSEETPGREEAEQVCPQDDEDDWHRGREQPQRSRPRDPNGIAAATGAPGGRAVP